ncbi:hypothetical protein BDV59DRAFT_209259 [Aspergillus ambiguus]|uniref:uncharacterized protein n=1 Tax=Aspergillus ambiguus TaxID=176160 RepID=UPI003CCCAA75
MSANIDIHYVLYTSWLGGYGYPILPYAEFALPVISTSGSNKLQHMRRLSTADFQDVVRPNVDTLYSLAILDLSQTDLVIDVPNITDRYWVFPFYDVYGDNYANLGSVEHNRPGKYRIRYDGARKHESGIQLCQNTAHSISSIPACEGYQGIVNAPTPYGTFVGRLLVKDNSTDLQRVHRIQNQTALYPVGTLRHGNSVHAQKLTTSILNDSLSADIPTRIMQMTARISPFNPPRNISDRPRVEQMLRKAGIKNGRYTPTQSNLTALAQKAEAAVFRHAKLPQNSMSLGHNWVAMTPSAQGDYGTDYQMRYYVASTGYLALTSGEAIYPSFQDPSNGGSTTLTLQNDEAYMITFESKPPLQKTGFWSVTGYNAQQYLIANPLDRYAVGDRSGLTYPDGSLVYGAQSTNQTFQVLVQSADVAPPTNWTSK